MEISIKRDGLTLRGDLIKPSEDYIGPVTVIFHGLMSDRGNPRHNMFTQLAENLVENGIASVKFDFNGHGASDGDFSDMNVFNEILDAVKIMDYVRAQDWVTDIYIVGHSQGGVVGGMTAGYYREYVKKLVLLAPAASAKDDALRGSCFGTQYDNFNTPEYIPMINVENKEFKLGNAYLRVMRTMPIYETTAMFRGKTLIIQGSDDQAVSVEGAQRYTQYLDNVTLNIIEGENHGLDAFSLDKVIAQTVDFLKNE